MTATDHRLHARARAPVLQFTLADGRTATVAEVMPGALADATSLQHS